MIYTCQFCGGSLPTDRVVAAYKAKEPAIACPYCASLNEINSTRSHYTVKGFDALDTGDFYQASYAFSSAIDDAKSHKHMPTVDAYLGYALSQFRVQVKFDEEDEARVERPVLTCHKCNEMYFADSEAYLQALEGIDKAVNIDQRPAEKARLTDYADRIDKIKDYYEAMRRTNGAHFKYSAFIAYEDNSIEIDNRGYEIANKVRNLLPDKLRNVFLPDREEYTCDEEYDAAVLYALENSNCMLVITDNSIDSRLKDLYSRFYFISRDQKKGGNNLGFIRYCGHITIALPDRTIAQKNVFDLENVADFCNFALEKNGVIAAPALDISETTLAKDNLVETDIHENEENLPDDFGDNKPFRSLPGKYIAFGHYPQRHVANKTVEDHFTDAGLPSRSDPKDWTPMAFSKAGKAYMWYRDDVVNGTKYRAVYFSRYRDLYTVQDSDIQNQSQLQNHYMPWRVYCFEFQPIIWNVCSMTNDLAVLVAHHGIDCGEFNNCDLSNNFETSSLHNWLNEDFVRTAFTEEEQKYLGMLNTTSEDDRIYLVDKTIDKQFYETCRNDVRCSDYFKCVGGEGASTVNSYWITAKVGTDDEEASVIYPSNHKIGLASQYVDCSGVAVLPKLVIKFSL